MQSLFIKIADKFCRQINSMSQTATKLPAIRVQTGPKFEHFCQLNIIIFLKETVIAFTNIKENDSALLTMLNLGSSCKCENLALYFKIYKLKK